MTPNEGKIAFVMAVGEESATVETLSGPILPQTYAGVMRGRQAMGKRQNSEEDLAWRPLVGDAGGNHPPDSACCMTRTLPVSSTPHTSPSNRECYPPPPNSIGRKDASAFDQHTQTLPPLVAADQAGAHTSPAAPPHAGLFRRHPLPVQAAT
jgi:hypothetical protein